MILVETVGVGQDEVEIVGTADVSVVVLVPGLGDEVQALKAGIMEIADVFVVNKADRDGVDRVVAEIESMLSLAPRRRAAARDRAARWRPRTRAPRELLEAVRGLPRRDAAASGALAAQAPAPAAAAARGRGARAADGARLPPRSCPRTSSRRRVERLAARARRPLHRRRTRSWRRMGLAMRRLKIDHLGIAVPSLDEAVARLRGARLRGRGDPRRADREGAGRLPAGGGVAPRAARADRSRAR